ncbi:MAG: glycosyltransferase family 2 protein [Cyanobacteria bacterium J06560_5]
MVRVAAVIPTYNRWEKTQRFLQHFSQQTYADMTTIIVDANSPDRTGELAQRYFPETFLLQVDSQQYWAGATNAGVRYALAQSYDYIFTINDDAVVGPHHVQQLVDIAKRHNIFIVGNRINYLVPSHRVWALGTRLAWGTPTFLKLQYQDLSSDDIPKSIMDREIWGVDTLPGDGVLIHRSVFEQVGLYQATFLPHYHADSELILRANRQGFQAYVAPHVVLQDDFSAEQKQQNLKSIAGLRYAFLDPRSHLYLPAIAYIFFRYCPWHAYPATAYYLLKRLLRLGKGSSGPKGNGG